MKIIKPSFEIFDIKNDDAPLNKIEICGRTCYQSKENMTSDTNEKFIKNIIKRGHLSVLEHGNIILEVDKDFYFLFLLKIPVKHLRFFKATDYNERFIISGNFRAWFEVVNNEELKEQEIVIDVKSFLAEIYPEVFESDIGYAETTSLFERKSCLDLYDEEVLEHIRPTVRFIADRGFLAEIRTHRDGSFSCESTRYCLYSKDGFEKQITVIKPLFFEEDSDSYNTWEIACETSEAAYMKLIEQGRSAQEARSVLPNSLKCEIICTANIEEWKHIFELRCAADAHPQMRELMIPLMEEMKKVFEF